MNWTGFYALSNAWLLLLFVPLLILYFLKLKRPRMEISSLTLWQQVINDQRVNSPFQKFKRNLLLLLQLLLLLALILAAMQPFLRSGADRAQYIPVLIDCSASMAAVDEAGVSRLGVAKQQISKLINDLLPDQQVSLIAFGGTARRLTSFTDNKRILRDALNKIDVLDVESELEDALRLSQALTRTVPIEKVLIYSDGNLPSSIDFELPFEVNYQRIAAATGNIGITAVNARRAKEDQWNLFVRLQASPHVAAANVTILQDDQMIAEDYVKLEASSSQRIVFQVNAPSRSRIQVKLAPDGADSLETDNAASLELPAPRPLTVYCPVDLRSFRHALGALGEVDLYPKKSNEEKTGTNRFDLYISESVIAEGYDATVRLYSGLVPPDLERAVAVNSGSAGVVDWKRNAALLQHVDLKSVIFSDEPTSFPGIEDGDFEQLGYEILAHSKNAPLILRRQDADFVSYFLLFNPERSTLPYRVAFPVMVANAINVGLRQAALSEVSGTKTGVLPPIDLAKADSEYDVVRPRGRGSSHTTNNQGLLSGVSAPYVGPYEISSGDDQKRITASLLSVRESSLAAVEELQFKELAIEAATETVRTDRPLWPYLAMCGFAFLLVEWWYSNRRSDIV